MAKSQLTIMRRRQQTLNELKGMFLPIYLTVKWIEAEAMFHIKMDLGEKKGMFEKKFLYAELKFFMKTLRKSHKANLERGIKA